MAYDDSLQSLQLSPLCSVLQQPQANLVELTSLPATPEIFAGQQLAHAFRWEIDQRQAFEDYCRWYAAIARQNQQEAASMANDIDIRAWFRWRR